jgi:hypothetical protein
MKTFFFFLVILLLLTACASGPSKRELDAEVDRLCAIDGGIRVYETVVLSPEKFDERGRINFYRPTLKENALGPEYIFKWDIYDYKKGNPGSEGPQESVMGRDHFKIIRKSDMKLLGEFVLYSRIGGDLPGPWVASSYRCPSAQEASSGKLIHKIFIQSIGETGK